MISYTMDVVFTPIQTPEGYATDRPIKYTITCAVERHCGVMVLGGANGNDSLMRPKESSQSLGKQILYRIKLIALDHSLRTRMY